jgi:hypothetical protein
LGTQCENEDAARYQRERERECKISIIVSQTALLRHQKHRKAHFKLRDTNVYCSINSVEFSAHVTPKFFRLHFVPNTQKKKACAFAHDLGNSGVGGQSWFNNATDTRLTAVCVRCTRPHRGHVVKFEGLLKINTSTSPRSAEH